MWLCFGRRLILIYYYRPCRSHIILIIGDPYLLIDLYHHVLNDLLDIFVYFGWRLEILHVIVQRELLGLLERHLSLFLQVDLITYQRLHDVGVRMLVDTLEPILNVAEGLSIGHIKGNYYSIGLLVKGVSNCAKPLLASSVPNLNRDRITLRSLKCCINVIQTDSRHMILAELLVLVPKYQNYTK